MDEIQNLGWANSWNKTPQIVIDCRAAKHEISDIDEGPPHRGMEHVVRCTKCNYVYRYDSSD